MCQTEYIFNFNLSMYFKHKGMSSTKSFISLVAINQLLPPPNSRSQCHCFCSHQNYIRNVTDLDTYCCALFHYQSCIPGLHLCWYFWLWEFRNTKTWWSKMAIVHIKFLENLWIFWNLQQWLIRVTIEIAWW